MSKGILLLGSEGFIGGAMKRMLNPMEEFHALTRADVDLADHRMVLEVLKEFKPRIVINAAGRVAGIQGNIDFPADLMLDNTEVSISVLRACHEVSIPIVIQFASACVYPLDEVRASRPEDIGTGKIEQTSASYATAKIHAIEMVRAFRRQYGHNWCTFIPTNLYGPGDWNHGSGGHVAAMLMEKFIVAKREQRSSVEVWGDGLSNRTFLHVDDLADAVNFYLQTAHWEDDAVNVSGDQEISIGDLANMICRIVGFEGSIVFNELMPNGARRKLLDDSYLRGLGWRPSIELNEGLISYFKEYSERI